MLRIACQSDNRRLFHRDLDTENALMRRNEIGDGAIIGFAAAPNRRIAAQTGMVIRAALHDNDFASF